MASGLLIIDNNCYPRLMDPTALARFRANLRVADFEPQASEINLLESTAASPDALQARLLASIREVVGERPLLPWPFQLSGHLPCNDAARRCYC
jgi:predicted RNA-binding Zn ribbon-like protein